MGNLESIHAEFTGTINASPETVYSILSDYEVGHPAILPHPPFVGLDVESGGRGAGTRFEVRMSVFGSKQSFRMEVTEPDPGRVLVEEDQAAGVMTTFTLEPTAGGSNTRLTIATDARPAEGLRGWVAKRTNPSIMRRIYKKQIAMIDRYANSDR